MNSHIELILPGGLPESKAYKLEAEALGKRAIGASCNQNDPDEVYYKEWSYIPSIHSNDFEKKFLEIVTFKGITGIFCPHLLLYKSVQKIIHSNNLDIEFKNPPPGELETTKISSLYNSAQYVLGIASNLSADQQNNLPSLEEVAGLLFYTRTIPGMTTEEKLAALISIFPSIPKGDVVEIGAYRGRSSYFLSWAAKRYNIGNVLAVDPWDVTVAQQNDSPDILKDPKQELVEDLNSFWEETYRGFLAALSPFIGGVNYLRSSSKDAAITYSTDNEVKSPTFGTTKYTGQISLLHIDGNHDYDMVKQDCKSWLKFMNPGGWIIFDDYLWLHGDGPSKAGDEYLKDNHKNIEFSFCFEKSLFIKLNK